MQGRLDFSRAEQLDLLRRKLPASIVIREGTGDRAREIRVAGSTCKLVLRTLDDYCRGRQGYPSERTIATDCGISVRSVKRVLLALQNLNLVAITRIRIDPGSRQTRNLYAIVWPELERYPSAGREEHRSELEAREQSAGCPAAVGAREEQPAAAISKGHRWPIGDHGSKGHGEYQRATETLSKGHGDAIKGPRVAPESYEPEETDPDPDPGAGSGSGDFELQKAAEKIPLLRAALRRVVPPSEVAPSDAFRLGVFSQVEPRDLRDLRRVAVWFRMQARAHSPVLGQTFAELLLVCACARRAATLPESVIRQSRVSVFVGLVRRRAWDRVLGLITAAFECEVASALASAGDVIAAAETSEVAQAGPSIFDVERKTAARDRRELEELEAAYGPLLDNLEAAERTEFARANLAPFVFESWQRSKGRVGRIDLLQALRSS